MARPVRSRPKVVARKARRPAPAVGTLASTPWPVIGKFLGFGSGQSTLGAIPYSSQHHTATANDGHDMLVALVQRPGETLYKFLSRLDRALLRALEKRIYVNELSCANTDTRPKPKARTPAGGRAPR